MPLELPDLNWDFERILAEAKRRIPVHTPEWTNFETESDPGVTLVQLFAFVAEGLLYRASQVPERNRLKFLQLLGIPLQPAAAARGIVAIRNERGPVGPLVLEPGVELTAGPVRFVTNDPVNVLPLEAVACYKRALAGDDSRQEDLTARHEALLAAAAVATGEEPPATHLQLGFYETTLLPLPQPGHPEPVVDLNDPLVLDSALYLALLAPKNVDPAEVRSVIANQTLSLGVVPALGDAIDPLLPQRPGVRRAPPPSLIYEIPDPTATGVRYRRLKEQRTPPVLNQVGVVQLGLPAAPELTTWSFDQPTAEGTGALPPRIEDEALQRRLVTWLRLRLPSANGVDGATARSARLSWVGVNATTVSQAAPVVAEPLGQGNGQPDQEFRLANPPVLPDSLRLEVTDSEGVFRLWRLTDDLLAAGPDDEVFTLDPEAGWVRFGGPRGARPVLGARLRASYRYGGGTAGNVAISAIQASRDPRLQGGYKIANPVPTWGGDTGETVAEAERNLPLYLRHRDRLVTDADFRDVTWRTPGVDLGRVEVLPLFRPSDPDPAPGAVTLLVIPRHDPVRPRWPTPDRLFLRTICEYLAPRRLITTELHVRGPTYIPVQVSAGIQVRAGHFPDQVVQAIRNRLDEYLSALPPGGPDQQGWPLDRKLLRKDLEAVITRVTGVDFVESLELGAKGVLGIEDQSLTGLELPMLTALAVREGSAEPLAEVVGVAPEQPPAVDILPVPVSKATC